MNGGYPEKRILRLKPELKHTVAKRVLPWDGKEVTVTSWHENITESGRKLFPNDKLVGFVKEFCADIPESELL